MNRFETTLRKIDRLLTENSIQYILIGGLAVSAYYEVRATQDIDITLLADLENLKFLHNLIVKKFVPAFSDSLSFFEKNFVLPVYDKITKLKVDFVAGLSEFDRTAISRCRRINIGKIKVNVCSIEDLIIYKLVASRGQDNVDVANLFKFNKKEIDRNYLITSAKKFIELERQDILEFIKKFYDTI